MFIRLGALDVPEEEDVRKAYDADSWDQSPIASRGTNEVFLMKEHKGEKRAIIGVGGKKHLPQKRICAV